MDYSFIFYPLSAAILTFVLLLKLPHAADKIGLVDSPDHRKHHEGDVPLIGGIAMFIAFTFSVLMLDISLNHLRGFFAGAILLIIVGVLDDLHELSSTMRFVAQILAAIFMAEWSGVRLTDLGHISPNGEMVNLNWWSSLLTIFATVGVINSLNMIDGIDGLAGYLSLVTVTALLILAYIGGDLVSLKILIILFSVISVFLLFNREPPDNKSWRRVFMGDAGSMFLGFVLCWFFIYSSQGETRTMSPVIALWIFAIPLIDTVAQMLRRLINGESPFKPDRLHVHHLLLDKGYPPKMTVLILAVTASFIAAIGIASQYYAWSEVIMFYCFIGCFGAFFLVTYKKCCIS